MDGAEYAMRSVPVLSAPGVSWQLLLRATPRADGPLLYWLPAMGVPTRHYRPLAEALHARGVGMALHEWRGIGSSNVRAGRRKNWGYRELLEQDIPAGMAVARQACPQASLLLGGHSLGGQLSCLSATLSVQPLSGLVLVASGAPYWRCFRPWGIPLRVAYAWAVWIARLRGHYPGRRLGFGGNEARGVITDWARSGCSGRYSAQGLVRDLEQALSGQTRPMLCLRLLDDAFGPAASLRYLLDKMPYATSETDALGATDLATRADHFNWMKAPHAVAARIADWIERMQRTAGDKVR